MIKFFLWLYGTRISSLQTLQGEAVRKKLNPGLLQRKCFAMTF